MKVLAATLNKVSNTKMFSIMLDIPTVLLAELRTHRILTQGSLYEHMELDDFNMSANSARAIPIDKYIEKVRKTPFIPIWTSKQKGMNGGEATKEQKMKACNFWIEHLLYKDGAIDFTEELTKLGIHKQNANRLLAPWAHTTCILSGTEWLGFFSLRCPHYDFNDSTLPEHKIPIFYSKKSARKWLKEEGAKFTELYKDKPPFTNKVYSLAAEMDWYVNGYNVVDGVTVDCPESGWKDDPDMWNDFNKSSAQPEFQQIAEQIYDLYCETDWKESKYHIPFLDDINRLYCIEPSSQATQKEVDEYYEIAMKISASMCAKLSYNTQENVDTLEKHLERADKLKESQHWEVFSHQAVAMSKEEYEHFGKMIVVGDEKLKEMDTHTFDNEIICKLSNGSTCVQDKGWAYNLKGFISQRYILENL